MSIPRFLQSPLWSYDLSLMNKKRDSKIIVTQVLNYGDRKQIVWLFSNYNKEEIKKILIHPSRGVWFRDKLRAWLSFFNIIIDPLEFEAAIKDLVNHRQRIIEEVFKRRGFVTT